MKRPILLALVSLGLAAGASAQIQFNKNSAQTGLTGKEALDNGNYRFMMNFNTNKKVGEKISDGNGKGFYGIAISNEGINGNKAPEIGGDFKVEHPGSNAKAVYFRDVQHILDSLSVDGEPAYSPNHSFWKYGNVLLNVPGSENDQAYALWPGMAKRSLFGFRVKVDGGGMISDIMFDLMTLDKGNTGKTATVKMIAEIGTTNMNNPDVAMLDTISESNVAAVNAATGKKYYVVDNIYTTSETELNKVTIKLAESMGVKPGNFNGKSVTVNLYIPSDGTSANPGMYMPIVGLDNITGEYGVAVWEEPAIEPNGRDTIRLEVVADEETAIRFKLKGKNRTSDLKITSDGDNKTSTAYYFKSEGAIMANDGQGNYTVPVEYTYTPTNGSDPARVVVKGDADGTSVDDDIEVTLYVKFAAGRRNYGLEIDNGARFWRNFEATLKATDNINNESADKVRVISQDNTIIVENATEEVTVTNTAGQVMSHVSADVAAKGISVAKGIYIVKTGNVVEKTLVK